MAPFEKSTFMPRQLFNSTIFPFAFFVLTFMFLMALAEDVGKPEKIFRHDRDAMMPMEPQRFGRVDLDNEELKRALEDLRRQVPEYTGYLLVDVVVEIFKMLFIFLLRLTGQQRHAPISE